MKETDNIVERIAVCPKCGQTYHGRPATSRADSRMLICPDCGTREALDRGPPVRGRDAHGDSAAIIRKEARAAQETVRAAVKENGAAAFQK